MNILICQRTFKGLWYQSLSHSTYLTNETCHHVHNLNLIYNFPQSLLLLGHMQRHLMLTLTHGQTIWPQQLVAAWSSTAPLKSLLPVTSIFPLFQPFHCFNHHSWPDKTSRNTWKTMQIPTVTCGMVKPISFFGMVVACWQRLSLPINILGLFHQMTQSQVDAL